MIRQSQRAQHEQWLRELTAIPTAAGHEQRIVKWVGNWVKRRPKRRPKLELQQDKAGNLLIAPRGRGTNARSRKGRRARVSRQGGGDPLYITAHLDHPAFVVRHIAGPQLIELEFRGGVSEPYFHDAAIEIFDAADRAHEARIIHVDSQAKPFRRVGARLGKATRTIAPGDIGRWILEDHTSLPTIEHGLLHTHACDDLAAVVAALAALDVIIRQRSRAPANIGVLLTRAEEVGFIGAIAACKQRSIPKSARLICLENSRSFAESPIGGGPILRVGDKMSVFEPTLTNRIGAIIAEHAKAHPQFKWQRKLMPGGTCEATTFSAFGHQSTCLCLPLGNYHNMIDIDGVAADGSAGARRPARVGPEFISISDFHGLVEMLVVIAQQIDSAKTPSLRTWMDESFKERAFVLR